MNCDVCGLLIVEYLHPGTKSRTCNPCVAWMGQIDVISAAKVNKGVYSKKQKHYGKIATYV